jgi:uncharacterized protein YndB with AHSA1/START domain
MSDAATVVHEELLDAPPEEVWPAVSEEDGLASWLGDEVALDVRPAGTGHVVDGGVRREVLVTDVEPGRRVAWQWWGDDDVLSAVEIVLAPAPHGTYLRIVETTLTARGPQASLAAGWRVRLGRLAGLTVLCHA